MQQIERYRLVPDVEAHLVHRNVFEDRAAGAVDQHIEFAELRHGGVDGLFHLRVLRDVGLNENDVAAGVADILFGTLADLGVDVDNGDLCAFLDKFHRAAFGDAGATAREKGYFSVESGHKSLLKIVI